MEIWGNYLPFIGFRTFRLNRFYDPVEEEEVPIWEVDVFVVEWLGEGRCLWQGPYRRVEYDL